MNSNFSFRCASSDIILKINMYYRKTEKANKFKTKLGFNPINLMSKEESVTATIIKSFPDIKRKNDKAVFCFRQKN